MLICDVLPSQIFSDPSTCDCSRSWLFRKGLGARFTAGSSPYSVTRVPRISNEKRAPGCLEGLSGMNNYPVL